MSIPIHIIARKNNNFLIETEDGCTAVIDRYTLLNSGKTFSIECDDTGEFSSTKDIKCSIISVFDEDLSKNVDKECIHTDSAGNSKNYRYILNPISSNTATLLSHLGYQIGEKLVHAYELCGGERRTKAFGYLKLVDRKIHNKLNIVTDYEVDTVRVALGHTNSHNIDTIEIANLSCMYYNDKKDKVNIKIYKRCSDARENKTYGEKLMDIKEFENLSIAQIADILEDLGITGILK